MLSPRVNVPKSPSGKLATMIIFKTRSFVQWMKLILNGHTNLIYIYNCTIHIHSGNSSIITEHSVSLKRESEVGIIAASYFPTTPIPHTETSRIIYFHVFINNLFFQSFRVNKVSFLYSLKNVASKHNYIYFNYILQD